MTQIYNFGHHTETETGSKPDAGLYIVSTPIGNLRDITLRAIDILKSADTLACEDTRVTAKLLSAYGLKARMFTYNDHTNPAARKELLNRIGAGEVVALVSDAGTPLISDPGYKLVEEAIADGYKVFPVPGPSALTAALAVSGLPTHRFFFQGFLPVKTGAQRQMLQELRGIKDSSIVFYESPRRLAETLQAMEEIFGAERKAVVIRELTKLHEEKRGGTLRELSSFYAAQEKIRGEIVIILGPSLEEEASQEDVDAALKKALASMSVKEASKIIAESYNIPRKVIYARALEMKDET